MSDLSDIPGYVSTKEEHGETTVVVERAHVRDACAFACGELGFNFLTDIVATDYLNWAGKGVSGYIGTATGRDLNLPMTQGLQALPDVKPARFALSYHLLALRNGAPRLRLQCWLEDGDSVDSVISVWPAADWFEREQYDLMGITFDGHPNLTRLLLDDDWEGHPLRKDYPIGGEPVRFSPEE